MAIQFFNPRMIRERIAQLTAMSGSPTNCGQPSREEAQAEIAKLESVLAECRLRKATAKAGTPMPLIACLADKTAVREAITARLEASKAAVAASAAKLKAQQAVAALKPANLLDQYRAMSAGPAKIAFLAKHGVAIQSIAKLQS